MQPCCLILQAFTQAFKGILLPHGHFYGIPKSKPLLYPLEDRMCVTVRHCPGHCAANESSEGRMCMGVCGREYVLISMKVPLIRPLCLLIVTSCVEKD